VIESAFSWGLQKQELLVYLSDDSKLAVLKEVGHGEAFCQKVDVDV